MLHEYLAPPYIPLVRGDPKIQTSMRLSRETHADLKYLSGFLRASMATCVEMAVAEMARRVRGDQAQPPKPRKR